jgi:hypothetical protein
MKSVKKPLWVAAFSLSLVAIMLAQLLRVALFVADHPVPFDADEANHASRGLQVYDAILSGGFGLWSAIRDQAFYPPLHSLLVAASYITGGEPSLTASRVCSLVPLAVGLGLLAIAAFRAARDALAPDTSSAACACLFAVMLGASSPLILANSVLCMPEALGFCLSACLLLFCTRLDRAGTLRPGDMGSLAVLAFALGLVKYAYAFFTVPAIVAAIVLWRPRASLSLRHAALFVASFFALVALWCAVSSPESMWHYLFGHEERHFVVIGKKLLFHPSTFVSHGTLSPALSFAAVALAAFGFVRHRGAFAAKLSLFAALAPHVILGFSEEQGSRHMVPSLVFVWYLAGLGLASFLGLMPKRPRAVVAFLPAAGVAALLLVSTQPLLSFIEKKLETNEDYMAVSVDMVEGLRCTTPILMLGRGDGFSAQWVRWYLAVRCSKRLSEVVVDRYPFLTATHEKSIRTGAPIARAYTDPSFPREPLSAVVDTGYYRGLIAFSQLGDKGEFKKLGLPELREKHPSQLSKHGDRRLLIMRLP